MDLPAISLAMRMLAMVVYARLCSHRPTLPLRRLPGDDAILSIQALLGRRIGELRRPLPAPPAELLTLVMRAKRLSDKRRRQLRRFMDGLEG